MGHAVLVAGAGMVKFAKPSASEGYEVMAEKAVTSALQDAGIGVNDIDQAFASYIYGDSTCGQESMYRVGKPGIPIFNVNNNCVSGSSAIFLGKQAIQSGAAECVLAFGFEQMQRGALGSHWSDRTPPNTHNMIRLYELHPNAVSAPPAPLMFGLAGLEYMEKYGVSSDIFAKVAVKSRRHAAKNPYALFTDPLTVDDVMNSDVVMAPFLRRLMCCPPTCGAAAVVLMSESFAKRVGAKTSVEIAGQGMASDGEKHHESAANIVGTDAAARAAVIAYEEAGVGPKDIDLVELHDCFTTNEVWAYEALQLCGEGEAEKFVDAGDNTYGGQVVVNPSGGLMSKGHPIGATGIAQAVELTWHLRGEAGDRQVENASIALQHNIGVPGGAAVTIYKKR